MGTTLTGTTPQDTYDSLIKVTNNGPLSSTARYLSDGLGNDSVLALSTARVGVGTATPNTLVELNSATNNAARIRVTGTNTTAGNYKGYEFGSSLGFRGGLLQDQSTEDISIFTPIGGQSVTIASAGNVGIGTSSPESKLHIADGVSGGTVSLFVDNNINALNSTAQIKFTVDAGGSLTSGGAAIQAVNTDPNYANTDLVFRNSHISSGSLVEVFRLTDGARYLRMASGTGGIQFGGDTAAANALDDYEEGTWTMSPAPSSTGTITLYSGVNQGRYTKIGRLVMIQGLAEVESVSSPTGTGVVFSGLPFAIPSPTADYDSRIGGAVSANIGGTNSAVSFQGFENTSSFTVNVNASTIATGSQFYFSFTYTV